MLLYPVFILFNLVLFCSSLLPRSISSCSVQLFTYFLLYLALLYLLPCPDLNLPCSIWSLFYCSLCCSALFFFVLISAFHYLVLPHSSPLFCSALLCVLSCNASCSDLLYFPFPSFVLFYCSFYSALPCFLLVSLLPPLLACFRLICSRFHSTLPW